MRLQATIGHRAFQVRLSDAIDISRPLYFDEAQQPQAFHLPAATARAFEAGGFVGDLQRGGSCRCDVLTLAPHGNGTHTECSAHVHADRPLLRDALRDTLVAASVITVEANPIIRIESLNDDFLEALVVRTLPNPPSKMTQRYSGTNPPYLASDTAAWLASKGVRHLLLDVPSADQEDDGGRLLAHRAFFGDRDGVTITEMIFVPDSVPDGSYLLNLQIAPFMLDAAPSRPILFPLQ